MDWIAQWRKEQQQQWKSSAGNARRATATATAGPIGRGGRQPDAWRDAVETNAWSGERGRERQHAIMDYQKGHLRRRKRTETGQRQDKQTDTHISMRSSPHLSKEIVLWIGSNYRCICVIILPSHLNTKASTITKNKNERTSMSLHSLSLTASSHFSACCAETNVCHDMQLCTCMPV